MSIRNKAIVGIVIVVLLLFVLALVGGVISGEAVAGQATKLNLNVKDFIVDKKPVASKKPGLNINKKMGISKPTGPIKKSAVPRKIVPTSAVVAKNYADATWRCNRNIRSKFTASKLSKKKQCKSEKEWESVAIKFCRKSGGYSRKSLTFELSSTCEPVKKAVVKPIAQEKIIPILIAPVKPTPVKPVLDEPTPKITKEVTPVSETGLEFGEEVDIKKLDEPSYPLEIE